MRQERINAMLGRTVKSNRSFYTTYGKVLPIMWWHIVAVLDRFVPTASIPTIFAKKHLDFEAFRVTIHKRCI